MVTLSFSAEARLAASEIRIDCCCRTEAGGENPMPRVKRIASAGVIQHVMNRGNRRVTIFRKPADYQAFIDILIEASRQFRVKLIAFSLMPNHWHLVLVAEEEGAISLYMRWVTGTHVRRYHKVYGLEGTGHLYQGRYTSVPVQSGRHLLVLMKYVESNASRARLVARAEEWPWTSIGISAHIGEQLLAESPVPRPPDWLERVNRPVPNLAKIRDCVSRGRPIGSSAWTAKAVARHGLEFTMRSRGRPSKVGPVASCQAGGLSPLTSVGSAGESARSARN
jgi:putative transposase